LLGKKKVPPADLAARGNGVGACKEPWDGGRCAVKGAASTSICLSS